MAGCKCASSGNGDQNVEVANSGLLGHAEGFGGMATVEASAQAQARVHASFDQKTSDVVEPGYGGQGMNRSSDACPSTLGLGTTLVSIATAGGGGRDVLGVISPTTVISGVSTGFGGGRDVLGVISPTTDISGVSTGFGGGRDVLGVISPTTVISGVSPGTGGGCGERQYVISSYDHEIEAKGGGKKEKEQMRDIEVAIAPTLDHIKNGLHIINALSTHCSGDVECGANTSSGECTYHEHAKLLKRMNPVDSRKNSTSGDVDGPLESRQSSIGSLDVASMHIGVGIGTNSEIFDQRREEQGSNTDVEDGDDGDGDDDDGDNDESVNLGSARNPILVGPLSSQDYVEIIEMCRPLEEIGTCWERIKTFLATLCCC